MAFLLAWVAAIFGYGITRLLGLTPNVGVEEMAGMSIGCWLIGAVLYMLLALAVRSLFNIWLWPFGSRAQ